MQKILFMLGIEEQILMLAAKREFAGLSMKDCFGYFTGLSYVELERIVNRLEEQELVRIVWSGPDQFAIFITPEGKEALKSLSSIKQLEALRVS